MSSSKSGYFLNLISNNGSGIYTFLNPDPVILGSTIDSAIIFDQAGTNDVPADGTNYYYAFARQTSGSPYYGWAEVSFSTDATTGTLVQWAYNDVAGESILAGQTSAVPEPATYGLLGAGTLAGIAFVRRRRRKTGRRA